MQFKPRKKTIAIDTALIKSSLLKIEVFSCLHKHVDVFLHDYANAIWSLKGIESFHLSTLVNFLCQKISITLQRMQLSSILSWVLAVGLATSSLPPL
jgi:hypothetical protein